MHAGRPEGDHVAREHRYEVTVEWTGNRGEGTSSYRSYARDHVISAGHASEIAGSSDPHFRGDATRWNPEQLLLAAASQCHLLSYLHQCAVHDVVVTGYVDRPTGTMTETAHGGGRFTDITLHPLVTVQDESMVEGAERLHTEANRLCFVANSLALPVHHDATTVVAGGIT
jgi:organic hydroperoxide reductase OsmC/OhrA